jgi:hypothetical protein
VDGKMKLKITDDDRMMAGTKWRREKERSMK